MMEDFESTAAHLIKFYPDSKRKNDAGKLNATMMSSANTRRSDSIGSAPMSPSVDKGVTKFQHHKKDEFNRLSCEQMRSLYIIMLSLKASARPHVKIIMHLITK